MECNHIRRGTPSESMRQIALPPVTPAGAPEDGGGGAGRCWAAALAPPTVTVAVLLGGGGGGGAEAGGVEACFEPTPDAQIEPSGATATAVTSRFGSW